MVKFFNLVTDANLPHENMRRLLTLPEQTRLHILNRAANRVAMHPWAQQINEEHNHQKAVKMVEQFMPRQKTTQPKKTVQATTDYPDKTTELMAKIEEIHNANENS